MFHIEKLKHEPVWSYFFEILKIPRPSKKEEKIIQYLLDFAKKHKLSVKKDETGNVLISKPAKKGYENLKTVILQSHIDMVCEKNNDTVHNFEKDPIRPVINDDWLTADGTTLGADNGIGIACQLELLAAKDIPHGNIECLFTVDEETGLTGAYNLEKGFFEGEILINLDSEDDGEIFIGCAGGIDTLAVFNYKSKYVNKKDIFLKIEVTGLKGGHSGDEIDKGRANANKLLNRFLWEINQKYGIRLNNFTGGNLRNAIPREASAIFGVRKKHLEYIKADYNIYMSATKDVWKFNEPKLNFLINSVQSPEFVLNSGTTKKFLASLYACPHGVFQMSSRMPGLVETSSNLASVKFIENNEILITTSQRSELEHQKENISQMVRSIFSSGGASVKHTDGYPGWAPNPNSEILNISANSYEKLFNQKPKIKAIHAGLECGLFLKKYPHLDMVSIGPTIQNAHSPDEKMLIPTVEKFWRHLLDILKQIPLK